MMLHPHPEARFQSCQQMQAHHKAIIQRQGGQAARLVARQREMEAQRQARELAELAELERRAVAVRLRKIDLEERGPREIRMLVQLVAEAHDLTIADVMGKVRTKKHVAARWAAIVAVRGARPRWSIKKTSEFFGVDHTSILHALKRHAEAQI